MRSALRFWQLIASRIDANRRAERQQHREDTTSIVRALSHHSTLKKQHDFAEDIFWKRQIKAAWWLNGITLGAAIIALGTVGILIDTLIDARRATVEANRAWLAPRTIFLQREFVLNDHPAFRLVYDNIGKEPALNANLSARVDIVDAGLVVHSLGQPDLAESAFEKNLTCVDLSSRRGADVIWPSSRPESYTNTTAADQIFITQEVLDGRAAVVIKGCYAYETFHEVHKSAFCFWFRQVPPSYVLTTITSAISCPIGNDAY